MGKLNDIRQKLSAGSTTKQLIDQGYAKSSVFDVAKKLKNTKPDTPVSLVSDELQDLRHQREIIKLQKEIAELEATKEKLPDRVAKLEFEVYRLNQKLPDLVATCFASLYMVILHDRGFSEDEARQEAISAGNDFLKHPWPEH